MNTPSPATSVRRAGAALAAVLLLVTLSGGAVRAQGFSSTSSSPPPAPAAAAYAVPFGSGPIASPTAPPAQAAPYPPAAATPVGLPEPAAQVAALGFSSVSGMSAADAMQPAGPAAGSAGSTAGREMADRVVVNKRQRTLQLMRGSRVIAQYPIKLGLNPYGHKQREGDFRTPEGRYTLNRRNPYSEFFLGIQVSYPSREDEAVARERGVSPGGLIMIHGQPNVPTRPPEWYATRDWTDGCIALSNADMIDVWQRTTLGLPIEILP